jgi:hypothetical protein
MNGSLKRAYELGMIRHSAREEGRQEIFPLFKATVQKANMNALNTSAADSRKGSNLGIADMQTGLITVAPSFNSTMAELEKSGIDRAQIIDKLNTGSMSDADIGRRNTFKSGWFIVNPSPSTKPTTSTWPKALEKNQDSLMNTTLPDGRQIEAIPLRSESGGVFALFRVPKN